MNVASLNVLAANPAAIATTTAIELSGVSSAAEFLVKDPSFLRFLKEEDPKISRLPDSHKTVEECLNFKPERSWLSAIRKQWRQKPKIRRAAILIVTPSVSLSLALIGALIAHRAAAITIVCTSALFGAACGGATFMDGTDEDKTKRQKKIEGYSEAAVLSAISTALYLKIDPIASAHPKWNTLLLGTLCFLNAFAVAGVSSKLSHVWQNKTSTARLKRLQAMAQNPAVISHYFAKHPEALKKFVTEWFPNQLQNEKIHLAEEGDTLGGMAERLRKELGELESLKADADPREYALAAQENALALRENAAALDANAQALAQIESIFGRLDALKAQLDGMEEADARSRRVQALRASAARARGRSVEAEDSARETNARVAALTTEVLQLVGEVHAMQIAQAELHALPPHEPIVARLQRMKAERQEAGRELEAE